MARTYSQGHVAALHVSLSTPSPLSVGLVPWPPRRRGGVPPIPIFLGRAAIEAAYNEYFDSSSDESSPPSPPVGRQAKVPRLQAPARGIPSRAPSLWAPSFANVELARAATLGGYAIALERRAANERYARQRRGLLRPAAVSRPSNGPAAPPPAAVRAAYCRSDGCQIDQEGHRHVDLGEIGSKIQGARSSRAHHDAHGAYVKCSLPRAARL